MRARKLHFRDIHGRSVWCLLNPTCWIQPIKSRMSSFKSCSFCVEGVYGRTEFETQRPRYMSTFDCMYTCVSVAGVAKYVRCLKFRRTFLNGKYKITKFRFSWFSMLPQSRAQGTTYWKILTWLTITFAIFIASCTLDWNYFWVIFIIMMLDQDSHYLLCSAFDHNQHLGARHTERYSHNWQLRLPFSSHLVL